MANIRERTKRQHGKRVSVFNAQVRMAGAPPRSATFATRRAAERWATTVEAEIIEGRHNRAAEASRRALSAAIERFIAEELPKNSDDSTAKLDWWRAQIGTLKLSQVTPAVLAEQRGILERSTYSRAKPGAKRTTLKAGEAPKQYKRSAATVRRYMAALSKVFTVARKEWHWTTYNPFADVSKPRESNGVARYLSDEERERLLAEIASDATLLCLVWLALSTAARAGELLALTWRDVDLKAGRITFPKTKNRTPRTVRVYADALALLTDRAKVRSLTVHEVFPGKERTDAHGKVHRTQYDYAKPFKAALKRAGITRFRFHDLRHTAATYLAMQGVSEQQLRAIGGWKSSVVSRYVHVAALDLQEPMQRLAAKVSGKEPAK